MTIESAEKRARRERAEHLRLAERARLEMERHRTEMEKHLAVVGTLDKLFPPELTEEQTAELERVVESHGKLTRLVEQIVLGRKGGKLRRIDVQKELVAKHGYTDSDAFKVTLFKTLQRLMKNGRVAGEKQDGTWFFWASVGP